MGLIKPRVEVNKYTTSQLLHVAKVRAQNNTTTSVIARDRTTRSGGDTTKVWLERLLILPACSSCQTQSLEVIFGRFQPMDGFCLFFGVTEGSGCIKLNWFASVFYCCQHCFEQSLERSVLIFFLEFAHLWSSTEHTACRSFTCL